jgi:hypothetical protein
MIPGRYNFLIRKGNTETIGVVLKERDLRTNVVKRIDLTGATVTWKIAGLTDKTGSAGLTIDLATSHISADLSTTETNTIANGAAYSLTVVFPSTKVKTYLVGTITVDG